jgi:hypothetical protein
MTARMGQGRQGALALALAASLGACGGSDTVSDPYAALAFGPIHIEPHSEDTGKCVSITLNNDEPLYVSTVELTTGPGFHHSNWLYVPEHSFAGPDGEWNCADRSYDQVAAGILGGVFFAQSTQSAHEVQSFPPGVVIKVPAHSKLVANIHLLNSGDEPLDLAPTMGFTTLPESEVTQQLASMDFEYHPLGLPPRKQSRFSIDCDIATRHQEVFGVPPDFKIYYALAHYHEWGTGLTLDAVRPDGTSSTIYSTTNNVGDTLGGRIEPAFDMTGFTRLRLTCDYYNDTDATIYYGNGGGEMCIFNAFSDSPHVWAGGALDPGVPGTPTDVNGVMSFTENCQVYSVEHAP